MDQNPLYSPQFLAGLAMMKGTAPGDALKEAAMYEQQMQAAQREKQLFDQQRYAQQMLPQILERISGIQDPMMKLRALVEAGIPPQDAALLLQRMGIGNDSKGGSMSANRELSAPELKINLETLRDYTEKGNKAENELRLLNESKEAIADLEKNTGPWTAPGSLYQRLPLPGFVDSFVLNDKAISAKERIKKINSQLAQNRDGATDAARATIAEGLPQPSLKSESLDSVISTLTREDYVDSLRGKFFKDWAAAHGNDLTGAENAFSEFIKNAKILNDNGEVNPQLLQDMQTVVANKSYTNSGQSLYERALAEKERRAKQGR